MSFPFPPPLKRERFAAPPATAQRRVLDLLMAQDGSTTRLCEAVAGGPIELRVLAQQVRDDVPPPIRALLPGTHFIERLTCLCAHGEVLMDNLSFIALAGLEPAIEADLRAGRLPIGHLLARLWVRREPLAAQPVLAQRLWQGVGLPDADATRSYRIVTPEAPRMVITETFRRGLLMMRQPG